MRWRGGISLGEAAPHLWVRERMMPVVGPATRNTLAELTQPGRDTLPHVSAAWAGRWGIPTCHGDRSGQGF